jgi:hypothetical protein
LAWEAIIRDLATRASFRLEVPEVYNYARDVVDARAAAEPGKLALLAVGPDGGDARRFSFADLAASSDRAARFLAGGGDGGLPEASGGAGGWLSWADGLAAAGDGPPEAEPTRSDDPMLVYFTSGTVAYPKMVLHTQASARSHQPVPNRSPTHYIVAAHGLGDRRLRGTAPAVTPRGGRALAGQPTGEAVLSIHLATDAVVDAALDEAARAGRVVVKRAAPTPLAGPIGSLPTPTDMGGKSPPSALPARDRWAARDPIGRPCTRYPDVTRYESGTTADRGHADEARAIRPGRDRPVAGHALGPSR